MSDEQQPSAGRFSSLRNTVRAGLMLPWFLARHLARRHRIDLRHRTVADWPEPPPPRRVPGNAQGRSDGVGPLVYRRYETEIVDSGLSASELIARLTADPNLIAPTAIAGFYRDDRPVRDLVTGDELVVELPGPWNGPVRVERADESELLLSTLDGHMEAGVIRFDVTDDGGSSYRFRIASWARSGDRAFEFLHLRLPIGHEIQTAMWIGMCRKAAAIAGVEPRNLVAVTNVLEGSDRS